MLATNRYSGAVGAELIQVKMPIFALRNAGLLATASEMKLTRRFVRTWLSLFVVCLAQFAAAAAADAGDAAASASCELAQLSRQWQDPVVLTQVAVEAPADAADASTCLGCHSNAGYLMGAVTSPQAPPEDGCASAPSRPHFINAFVRAEFPASVHGKLGCVACHGGDDSAVAAAAAHAGMRDANAICASCHGDIARRHASSLHATLDGMAHALRLRSGDDNFATLEPMWQADCATCHASCSDCHLTLPQAVGGGLLKGHEFLATPPMADTCASCHGSRAGAEYLGLHDGIAADVHFEAGMHCIACHNNDLHGDGRSYQNRWQVAGRARCTDCHAALPNAASVSHQQAHAEVACQVCHAQPYQNCFACHSGEEDGAYFRRAGNKSLDVREPAEWAEGIIPGSLQISLTELPTAAGLARLPVDRKTAMGVYCKSGHRSALSLLHNLGYTNAINMAGGFEGWKKAEYPYVVPAQ